METSSPRHPPSAATVPSGGTGAEGNSVISVKDLLSRIRWDPEFGRGRFSVGYEDHVTGGNVRVPFSEIKTEEGDGFSFSLLDAKGVELTIPYHRVRVVLRDGVVIWHRSP